MTVSWINGSGMTLERSHRLLVSNKSKKFISAPDGDDNSDEKHHK
jgi:hypothetical protein